MKQKYVQECTNCGNVVVGREKRGFIRDALHGGPGTAVEFIPVGGKLIWKASKEIVLRLLRTDMEKWGDELEDNNLLIHLNKIDQIGGILDKIEILNITFDEVNANFNVYH